MAASTDASCPWAASKKLETGSFGNTWDYLHLLLFQEHANGPGATQTEARFLETK
jgi:hypothetical protein